MTAILVGRAPQGNFIVSDDIVSHKDKAKSYKEYDLEDKIIGLWASNCYCALVGDMKVLDGIRYLDDWFDGKNIKIDFSKAEIMKDALIAAGKVRERWIKQGCQLESNALAIVYFVNQEKVFEYKIILKNNIYNMENFRFLSDDEVIVNYGSAVETITNFTYSNEQIFQEATKYIESFHNTMKRKAKSNPKLKILHYDFVNRFCGVVYTKKKNERARLYSPFNKLSEVIAADAWTPKMKWKLIEDGKFSWSPEDDVKHPKKNYK